MHRSNNHDLRIEGSPYKYGYILIACEKSTINELKIHDIKINKEIGEKELLEQFKNKKNILDQWSSFSTNVDKPGMPYFVKVIKVFQES